MRTKRILRTEEMAQQIAELVNRHNQWRTTFTGQRINRSSALYIVESFNEIVLGTVGVQQKSSKWTEIKHLVVRPEIREVGLGKRLVKRAIEEVQTPYMFANVRDDNRPSLKVFLGNGFFPYHVARKSGYELITMARFSDGGKNDRFLTYIQNRQARNNIQNHNRSL
jgi:GNAT superfamily N-acetyltransferase